MLQLGVNCTNLAGAHDSLRHGIERHRESREASMAQEVNRQFLPRAVGGQPANKEARTGLREAERYLHWAAISAGSGWSFDGLV